METKICNKCGQEKEIDKFEFRTDTKKYRNTCIECRKIYLQKWHQDNLEHVKEYNKVNKERISGRSKKYYEKNSEYLKEYSKQFRKDHKEYYDNYNKIYKETHKFEAKEYNRKWQELNKAHRQNYRKQYRSENREAILKYTREHLIERRKNDPLFKLKGQLRHLIYHSLERKGYKKGSKTEKIIGCDYATFISYLLNTYRSRYGIDWDGKEDIHIDHIIPLSTAKSEEDVIKLCYYTNLQLLKAKDNLEKSDKLDWPSYN